MKAANIEIGGVYLARVSGNLVPLKVLEKKDKGYRATNLKTGREIHTRSAGRFHRKLNSSQVTVYMEMKRV